MVLENVLINSKKPKLLGRHMLLVLCCVCLVNVWKNFYGFVACFVNVLIKSEGHKLKWEASVENEFRARGFTYVFSFVLCCLSECFDTI